MNSTALENLRTVDGHDFRVLATGIPGAFPTVIFVEGFGPFSLTADNQCPTNAGMSLVAQPRRITRYVNFYRAADGGFTPGSKTYASDSERLSTRDSARALFGVRIDYDDTTGSVTATKVS